MFQLAPAVVRLKGFEVDLRCRQVRKNGVPLALQERPFQVLEILLASAGNVVTRDDRPPRCGLLAHSSTSAAV